MSGNDDQWRAAEALHANDHEVSDLPDRSPERRSDSDAELESDRETAAHLASLVAPVAPPPEVRERLLSMISERPEPIPAVDSEADSADVTTPSSNRRRWFTLAASVAGVLIVGGGGLWWYNATRGDEATIAIERIEQSPDAQTMETVLAGGERVTMYWSATLGEAVLASDDMPVLDDSRSYELWIIDAAGPTAAGLMAGGHDSAAIVEGSVEPGDIVAVTIEQSGGSPTGTPSGDPIVAIGPAES